MFAIVENNTVTRLLPNGGTFTHNDVQYPGNWLTLSTDSERTALGIYPVTYGSPVDQRFYRVTQEPAKFNEETATVIIAYTATPIPLADVQRQETKAVNSTANVLLSATDWMVVRALDVSDKPIPEIWSAYRAAVRAEATRLTDAVAAATDTEAVIAVVGTTNWPVAPQAPNFG